MKIKVVNKKGFTLIELIMGIVIILIISVMAGMGLVQIANAYMLAKKSAVAAQQSQIVMTRLSKELTAIEAISSATTTSITYKRFGPLEQPHTIAWTAADQPLTLDGDKLIDNVQVFSLTYYDNYSATASSYSSATMVIELSFQLKGYSDTPLTFIKRVTI